MDEINDLKKLYPDTTELSSVSGINPNKLLGTPKSSAHDRSHQKKPLIRKGFPF